MITPIKITTTIKIRDNFSSFQNASVRNVKGISIRNSEPKSFRDNFWCLTNYRLERIAIFSSNKKGTIIEQFALIQHSIKFHIYLTKKKSREDSGLLMK